MENQSVFELRSGGRKRADPELILVVEDDLGVSTRLAALLEARGYTVLWVADGHAALHYLQEGPRPALILLDLLMDRMDGVEFRQKQRQDPALVSIPVGLISGLPLNAAEKEGFGAAGYFGKPYDVEAILAFAARYCRSREGPAADTRRRCA
jgi:CheY-like chemotaxis protein